MLNIISLEVYQATESLLANSLDGLVNVLLAFNPGNEVNEKEAIEMVEISPSCHYVFIQSPDVCTNMHPIFILLVSYPVKEQNRNLPF